MAGAKKKLYTEMDLQWAEEQLSTWRAYIDANPLHTLKDREAKRDTAKGGFVMVVVATIEQQGKYIQETLKNYLSLLPEVEKMREAEQLKKQETRGDQDLSALESGELDE